MKTALLTSYEKDAALVRLGKMLTDAGWTLLGSAGTAKYLNENGVACRDVAEIVERRFWATVWSRSRANCTRACLVPMRMQRN